MLVATDIMLFAGIDPQDVRGVLEEDIDRPKVTRPITVPWLPWVSWQPRLSLQARVQRWRARIAEFVSREEDRQEEEEVERKRNQQ